MVSESPPFWWKKPDWKVYALYPISLLYGAVAAYRMANGKRVDVGAPVICVGNFTVGGAGKTPTAIALAHGAKAAGLKPGILSRGYGGGLDVTTVVDPHHHRARATGDEPLLLAQAATTVISRNRIDGARKLVEMGVDVIIMDDGFQSARLKVDYALLVIDASRGIGNGFTIPAGPVRAPLKKQFPHVTALLKVGSADLQEAFVRTFSRAAKPVHVSQIQPLNGGEFKGQKCLAFAGIAHPQKFYDTLKAAGADIVETRNFPDHHLLSKDEIASLIADAESKKLQLVTTAKDHIRFSGEPASAKLASLSKKLDIEMAFDNPSVPKQIVELAVSSYKKRRLAAGALTGVGK